MPNLASLLMMNKIHIHINSYLRAYVPNLRMCLRKFDFILVKELAHIHFRLKHIVEKQLYVNPYDLNVISLQNFFKNYCNSVVFLYFTLCLNLSNAFMLRLYLVTKLFTV